MADQRNTERIGGFGGSGVDVVQKSAEGVPGLSLQEIHSLDPQQLHSPSPRMTGSLNLLGRHA